MKKVFHIVCLIFVFSVLFTPMRGSTIEILKDNFESSFFQKTEVFEKSKKICCVNSIKSEIKKRSVKQNLQTSKITDDCEDCNDCEDCSDCDPNCCRCAPNSLNFTVPEVFEFEHKIFNSKEDKLLPSYFQTYTSTFFLSLWLPPKLV